MSLRDQIANHEVMESVHARRAVVCAQSGERDLSVFHMAEAATNRHLAYELLDTDRIAAAAHLSMVMAAS